MYINYLQSLGPARLALAVVFFTFLAKILYRAYLTPLRKVPGPWYARLTHLVLKYHVVTGRRLHYIHSLHLKYGPVVLIAPTEVEVSSLAGFRKIHNFTKPFLKSPWYQSFTFGSGGIFTMIDPKEHSNRRKLFSQAMSKSYLRTNWEVEVRKKVEMAVQKIRRDALQGEADIFKWFTYMATDVMGTLSFGEGFDTLETEKVRTNGQMNNTLKLSALQPTQYTEDLMHVVKMGGVRSELPTTFAIGSFLKIPMFITPEGRMLEYGTIAVRNAKSQSSAKPTIFRKMLAESEKSDSSITDFEVREEAKNLIVAGSDTTGITIMYLLYNVLKNPYLQKQLETEVQTLPEEFTSADVEELKLLNAVIEEALRLYGAAPGGLPRMVPKGGADIDGYYLPEDITVSTQAYTIHRDPTIFAEPER
ncbi:cytochrome P450 protein [Rutstroemia sp. NJR-2017a WRK4]|nr:cytochrome P450 protein [Rutstroemia sp. NJR-2017a WRK4]